jgi:hypothetical protein
MDLVSGAKRVIVAMQHTAKGASKIVRTCTLPITSTRVVDLVVIELAVIAFPDGRATLLETAPGISRTTFRKWFYESSDKSEVLGSRSVVISDSLAGKFDGEQQMFGVCTKVG